jgi:hypothetical protein
MPSHLISLPGVRTPSYGVPLGSKLTHLSESAVHGSPTKPVSAPTHLVSQPKTH